MHHAYLVIGDFDSAVSVLDKKHQTPGPDVLFLQNKSFGIDDARTLKEMSYSAPLEGGVRIFVIGFTSITTEAQNALLKLFEEPPATARFYISVPREDLFIPTLRSRLHRIETTHVLSDISKETLSFIQKTPPDRLEEIASRLKNNDHEWVDTLVNELERYFDARHDYAALKEIEFVQQYLHTRSSSKKMLLEHLALSLSVTA